MFVDAVPIKWAALSWMVSSFLSVVGAAPIQASGDFPHISGGKQQEQLCQLPDSWQAVRGLI